MGKQPRGEPDGSLAELARRYLRGHGPAEVEDFASWSGIPIGQARRGFQLVSGELEQVPVSKRQAWSLKRTLPPTRMSSRETKIRSCIRLLAAFDPYLLGYHSRDLALAPRFARRIQAGGGWIHPTVMVDGRLLGTWRSQATGKGLAISVKSFERLDRAVVSALEGEAAEIGRFLGRRLESFSVDRARARARSVVLATRCVTTELRTSV